MPRTRRSHESSFAHLAEDERAQLDAIEKRAVQGFKGQLDELEKAIGIEAQESRDEDLYLAYAGLKAAVEEEKRVPVDDVPFNDGEVGGED